MKTVDIPPLSTDRFGEVLGPSRYPEFTDALRRGRARLEGRALWHVNSTARGGGVAEMLRYLVGYLRGAGIDARWAVVDGSEEFFEVTKRIHNRLHGQLGDRGSLGDVERRTYEDTLRGDAEALTRQISSRDVVVLHDPQTVGLAPALRRAGTRLVWTCHIGVDVPNDVAREAWAFLTPYVRQTDAHVFSRGAYAWDTLDRGRIAVIPPCTDPFTPKNQPLDRETVATILEVTGIAADGSEGPRFVRGDGTEGEVARRAEVSEGGPIPPLASIVAQVSRWDALKDHVGVLRGFARIDPVPEGWHLVLAGPAVESVTDDPQGREVLAEVRGAWSELPPRVRERVRVASLPMDDLDENGAIVNALQRRAQVIVQKSLAEGFGLTVTEAMWKERPVLGTRVGGIQDQIVHGESGVLIDDPTDLDAFARALVALLEDPESAARLGRNAQARVRDEYLPPRLLGRYLDLIDRLESGEAVGTRTTTPCS